MMTDVVMDRSRAATLIGRGTELKALLRAAGSADSSGPTRMVLLSGDAGVGKTRLVTEVLDRLGEQGWHRLVGHCLDFGEASMPYLPVTQMLAAIAQTSPVLAERLSEDHPALRRLRHASSGATSGEPSEALDRVEVFETVHALIEDLVADAPVLMVLEDAHWADASTRDLVSFLLSRRFSGRFLCLVTFRSDEMHRRHPLRQRVAEWVRLPGVERVLVEPLSPGAVRGMVTQIIESPGALGERHDADLERIVQRSQGNPFYVEELVAAFLGGGWTLPEDLADLLLVRLDRLDETARSVVRVASAAGQRVPHDLLAAVTPLGDDELDQALRAAVEAHVLVLSGESEYAFRHALLGEAVYDDLLPGERMRLHTAYAEAVRALRGEDGAAELARHALASHDLPTALEASVTAGEQAMQSGGPEEAARHFGRALEIYDRAAGQLTSPPDEGELVARTVDALCSAGRPETALSLADSHLQRLPPNVSAHSRARLLLARIEALRSTETDLSLSQLSAEALELVGKEPTTLRARMLASHAQALVWDDRFDEARGVVDETIELAERLDLPRLAADASMTLTWLSQHLDLGEEARTELKRIIAEALARGDLLNALRGTTRLGGLEYDYGQLVAAQEASLQAVRLAARVGRPWAVHGIVARLQAAVMATMRGRWDEALAIADHTDEDPPPTPRAMLDAAALAVAAGRGDVTGLDRLAALRERWHREGLIAVVGGGAAIELLGRRDGPEAAVQMYDDICAVLVPLWSATFGARFRLATLAVAALADAAHQTPKAARDDVRATAARLVEDARRVEVGRSERKLPFAVEGRAWQARMGAERMRLEWLLGGPTDLPAMVAAWREAAELFAELGQPVEEARARARLAVVLRSAGEHVAAQEQAAIARATAVRLGAKPVLEELGDLGRSAAPAATLTPREQEVLALVATGRSNAAIGTQLFISAKTVSVHVSNVMTKVGAGSRTEAVALARRAGLIR